MHSAAAVRHRRRLTEAPAACPSTASRRPVHRQVHGVVPLISVGSLPPALDVTHDGLGAFVDMDVLDRDFLLPFPAVPVERIKQYRVSARQLVGLGQILAVPFERLLANHGAPIAFHCGIMRSDKLGRNHALDFVFRADPDQRSNRRTVLLSARFFIGMPEPKCLNGLVRENVIPMIGLRSANSFQAAF